MSGFLPLAAKPKYLGGCSDNLSPGQFDISVMPVDVACCKECHVTALGKLLHFSNAALLLLNWMCSSLIRV